MTAISLKDCTLSNTTKEVTPAFKFIMFCEGYLRLGTRMAHPILHVKDYVVVSDLRKVETRSESAHWVTAFKILSYCTGIFPLIAFIVALLARRTYSYEMVQSADEIFERLYLGGADSFATCTRLRGALNVGIPNPYGFQHIITVCPIKHLAISYQSISAYEKDHSPLTLQLQQHGVKTWFYTGHHIGDHVDDTTLSTDQNAALRLQRWLILVHDLTFSEPETNIKDKVLRIAKLNPMKWFQMAFQILDYALFSLGEKVLVHCQRGASRSVTLVVAYLIYRGFPAKNAMTLVQMRRPCAKSRFSHELLAYETRLRKAQAKAKE